MPIPIISIIDDSEDYLNFLRTTLERIVPEVELVFFKTPDEAKGVIKQKDSSLILCDINFNPEDETDNQGLELLHWLKKELLDIPVIMMTRYLDQGFKEEAVKQGADGFLAKPISLAQLREIVNKYLGS